MPSFTLGCGTWGGSSVSENVTPMHLINIKRVAYGLKDCTTLASADPTFNYNLSGGCGCTTPAAAVPQVGAGCCGGGPGAFSPAQYAAMGAALNSGAATCQTPSQEGAIGQADLMDLVNQIVAAMKGAN